MAGKTKTTLTFSVDIEQPTDATIKYVAEYVMEALATHAGGLDPNDCMYDFNRDSLKVSLRKRETLYG